MGTQQVPKFRGLPPKMVFGHNLHLMAPFELIPAGFCIIFRRASFSFFGHGAQIWARAQIYANILAGELLAQKMRPGKHGFVWK